MEVKVKFRFNKATGEVEVFDVEDTGPMTRSASEHNREHDHVAAEIGRVLERHPHVTELMGTSTIPEIDAHSQADFQTDNEVEQQTTPQRDSFQQRSSST